MLPKHLTLQLLKNGGSLRTVGRERERLRLPRKGRTGKGYAVVLCASRKWAPIGSVTLNHQHRSFRSYLNSKEPGLSGLTRWPPKHVQEQMAPRYSFCHCSPTW